MPLPGIAYPIHHMPGCAGAAYQAVRGADRPLCALVAALAAHFQGGTMRGEMTGFSDDDVLHPDAFAAFHQAAADHPEQEAWLGHAEVVEADGDGWRRLTMLRAAANDLDCRADGLQVCVRKRALERLEPDVWPEDPGVASHADGVFLSRLGAATTIHPLDFVVGRRRLTPQSVFTKPGEWNGPVGI